MAEPVGAGITAAVTMAQKVLLAIPDLFFGVRVADVARALGFTPVEISLAALPAAVDEEVALIVIETGQQGDWEGTIRAVKGEPRTASIPVLAYGSHVNVAASRAAVAAGADRLVTRGKLMAELPQLLAAAAGSE